MSAKCQEERSTPSMTPANATLSSKHGQSSAGSGWTRTRDIINIASRDMSFNEAETMNVSNAGP